MSVTLEFSGGASPHRQCGHTGALICAECLDALPCSHPADKLVVMSTHATRGERDEIWLIREIICRCRADECGRFVHFSLESGKDAIVIDDQPGPVGVPAER